jgi:hypothetical protein
LRARRCNRTLVAPAFFFFSLPLVAIASPTKFVIDIDHTEVGFEVPHLVVSSVTGFLIVDKGGTKSTVNK